MAMKPSLRVDSKDLLDSLRIVHYVKVMLGRLEYVRDREDGICLIELLKRACGYLCDIEYACLDQLDHGAVVAELTVRVNVEGIIGFLLHFIAHAAGHRCEPDASRRDRAQPADASGPDCRCSQSP